MHATKNRRDSGSAKVDFLECAECGHLFSQGSKISGAEVNLCTDCIARSSVGEKAVHKLDNEVMCHSCGGPLFEDDAGAELCEACLCSFD
jgi:hypothetical protein